MSYVYIVPLVIFLIALLLKFPIGLGMMSSGVVFFLLSRGDVGIVCEKIMGTLFSNYVMVSIPLFIFTANIMNSGQVTEKMFTFCKALIGNRKGALAHVNILVSLIFSGMTGSAVADAAGIGLMEIEAMKKDGYDAPFSCAITAATATIGPIFPPSIPLVIYSCLSGASVGALFMGGMVPAVLMALSMGIYVVYISNKRNYPTGIKFSAHDFWKFTFGALPALLTPVILIGGIYSGFVTATEAGAIAAFYAIIISIFVYRSLTLKQFIKALRDTALQSGSVLIMSCGAIVLAYIVTVSGMSAVISEWIVAATGNKYVFILLVNIVFLLLGMLLDTQTILYVFIPLILPVLKTYDINLVHFGVMIVLNMMIGLITPPYGLLCFITSNIAQVPLKDIFREVIGMLIPLTILLLLIAYCPPIVLTVSSVIG